MYPFKVKINSRLTIRDIFDKALNNNIIILLYIIVGQVPENTITDLEEARLDPLIPYCVTKELNNAKATVELPVLLFGIYTLFL